MALNLAYTNLPPRHFYGTSALVVAGKKHRSNPRESQRNSSGISGSSKDSPKTGKKLPPTDSFEVQLNSGRIRYLVWAAAGIVGGILAINYLGTFAKWLGVGFVLWGVYCGYNGILALLHPAGRLVLSGRDLLLPTGVANGKPHNATLDDLRHVYWLRRSVPFLTAGPLLVVETSSASGADSNQTFLYPRDWFTYDADQKKVADVLRHQLNTRKS